MDLTEGVGEHQQQDLEGPSLPPLLTSLLTLSPDTGQTIDDRLAAVLEAIREWDWRAGASPHTRVPLVVPVPESTLRGPKPPKPPKPPAARAAPALRTTPTAPAPPTSPGHHAGPTRPAAPPARVQPNPPMVTPHLRALPTDVPPRPPSPGRPLDTVPPGRPITPVPAPPTSPRSTPPDVTLAGRPGWNTDAALNTDGQKNDPPTNFQAPQPRLPAAVPLPPIRLLPPEPEPDSDVEAGSEAKTLTVPAVQPSPHNVVGRERDVPDGPIPPESSEDAASTEAASTGKRWPKNFGKLVLILVTILIVVVIVAIIRRSAGSPSPGSLSPTSVTPRNTPPSTTTPAIPVSSAVSSAFTTASLNLNAANATVTRELAGGTSQSVGQVAQELAPYVTALNTFNFQTHFLAWPATLQVPSEDLTLRTKELISYMSSISTTSPATLTSWFAQFHSLARTTQEEDNVLRKDLGMSPTTSYPTK